MNVLHDFKLGVRPEHPSVATQDRGNGEARFAVHMKVETRL